jgi:hypothetical protein
MKPSGGGSRSSDSTTNTQQTYRLRTPQVCQNRTPLPAAVLARSLDEWVRGQIVAEFGGTAIVGQRAADLAVQYRVEPAVKMQPFPHDGVDRSPTRAPRAG